jgi:hypothetical protein
MNPTDMELQTIRQKLQSLKASPPPSESLSMPWSPPLNEGSSSRSSVTPSPNQAQVSAAIATLRQRSHPATYPDRPIAAPSVSADALVSQEVQRFQTHVSKVNALAQQQATAVLGLKQLAEEIEHSLRTFGIESHTDLDPIAHFFADYDTASILTIARDRNGHYCLDYQTVDFYQAEREAALTAQALREGVMPFSALAHSTPRSLSTGRVYRRVSRFLSGPGSQTLPRSGSAMGTGSIRDPAAPASSQTSCPVQLF